MTKKKKSEGVFISSKMLAMLGIALIVLLVGAVGFMAVLSGGDSSDVVVEPDPSAVEGIATGGTALIESVTASDAPAEFDTASLSEIDASEAPVLPE